MSDSSQVTDVPAPRRRTAWIIGAIAVVIALVAGAFIGRISAPESAVPVAEAPPSPEPTAAGVPASVGNPAKIASPMIWPGMGTSEFIATSSVPNKPGKANGYYFDDTGIDRETLITTLASVLGVAGTPTHGEGGWSLGDTQNGPSLWVGDDALASWSYWANVDVPPYAMPASDAVSPASDGSASDGSTDAPSATSSSSVSESPLPKPSAAPGGKAAEGWTRDLFTRLGLDDANVEWGADSYDPSTTVIANYLVDGERTQLSWGATWVTDRYGKPQLSNANGFAAGPVVVLGYPVIGAKDAIARLTQPGWSALPPAVIYSPNGDQTVTDPVTGTPTPQPSLSGRPVLSLAYPVAQITGAELGIAQYYGNDGGILLLPSYVISDAKGHRWTVLAVADQYVDLVPTEPYDGPMPMARAEAASVGAAAGMATGMTKGATNSR